MVVDQGCDKFCVYIKQMLILPEFGMKHKHIEDIILALLNLWFIGHYRQIYSTCMVQYDKCYTIGALTGYMG